MLVKYSEEFGERNISISFLELIHNNRVINVEGGYVYHRNCKLALLPFSTELDRNYCSQVKPHLILSTNNQEKVLKFLALSNLRKQQHSVPKAFGTVLDLKTINSGPL